MKISPCKYFVCFLLVTASSHATLIPLPTERALVPVYPTERSLVPLPTERALVPVLLTGTNSTEGNIHVSEESQDKDKYISKGVKTDWDKIVEYLKMNPWIESNGFGPVSYEKLILNEAVNADECHEIVVFLSQKRSETNDPGKVNALTRIINFLGQIERLIREINDVSGHSAPQDDNADE